MRTKKALLNTLAGLSYQIVALVCGMILPRMVLGAFGSSYNGVTNSISQFLSCIVLLRSGIAGVTRAALYRPLSDGDNLEYSRILRAAEIFMRRVALIFVGFLVVFSFVYPMLVNDEFEWIFTASLVMILGISTFSEYYFGFTYEMILNADQRQCVISFVRIFTTILNTVVAGCLIKAGFGIHMVKLGSALVFILNPLFINYYAHRKYKIIRGVEPDNRAVSQRWDAFAHQVANFVFTNTDIMVLTLFTNTREVSVYCVYYLVINGLTRLLRNTIPGVASAFGDMMAKKQDALMAKNFRIFELVVYVLASVLFTTCGIMLVPFVMLYTKGVLDVDYSRPLFAALISIAAFFGCARIPYQHVVEAAGHYRQTKKGAYFEAALNLSVSLLAVSQFGLVGVSVGTLGATLFRTIQYAVYLDKYVIHRSHRIFAGHILISVVTAVLSAVVYAILPPIHAANYGLWVLDAGRVFAVVCILTAVLNGLFYGQDAKNLFQKLAGILKGKKK